MQPEAQFSKPMLIDSNEDPEAAAAAAASILSEDDKGTGTETVAVPFISLPPESVFKLPGGGLIDADGTFHSDVEVRELTGADEEALSKAEVAKSMARYMQTIVRRGTVRIGDHDKPNDRLLGELLVGDREMVLLAIRRATYGDSMELTMICPACTTAVDANYDLASEVPIRELDDPLNRRIEVTLKDGRLAVARLPTSADQDIILNLTNKSLAEANTVLLARCLVTINGVPSGSTAIAQSLSIPDRRKLLDEMTKLQPGPKYGEVPVECPGCGNEFPSSISLLDLFRG